MENTIKSLAGARKEIADLQAKIERLNESIALSPQGVRVRKAMELIQDYTSDAKLYREAINEMTVLHFDSTADKHPHPAVTVNVRTALEYEEEDAVQWAIDTKQTHLLSIKKSAFEKIARADIQIPGVVKKQVTTASIKRDLSLYL